MQYERVNTAEAESPWHRRDLSISIIKVDLRLYRRTRNCCDIARVPPHFVYHLRLEWTGETLPRLSPCGSPSSSPRGERSTKGSPRRTGGPFEEPETWWKTLPRSYVVKRRWHEIVRFHEALVNELTYDAASGCYRVKAKVPDLPSKGDLDSWTNSYAATGDACALSRRKKLDPPTAAAPRGTLAQHAEAPMDDLQGLHWIYVELRLAPYFVQVNNILRELPTHVLANSGALRRFVTPGSRAAMQKAACSSIGLPRRFLGALEPVTSASAEDIDAAVRFLRQTNPNALRSFSAPSLGNGGLSTKRGTSSSAAAKLVVAAGSGSSPSAATTKLPSTDSAKQQR